jgi:hypothetical protein
VLGTGAPRKLFVREYNMGQLVREYPLTAEEIKMIFGFLWPKANKVRPAGVCFGGFGLGHFGHGGFGPDVVWGMSRAWLLDGSESAFTRGAMAAVYC